MKKAILLLSLFFYSIMNAQLANPAPEGRGVVFGKVIDQKSGAPIPYATVSLKWQENPNQLFGSITDENGFFEVKGLPEEILWIEVQFIGYKNFASKIDLTQSKRIDIGVIKLEEVVSELAEVSVVGEQSTVVQKIDRKVINVGKDITTMGATAADIMGNLPSLSVDQDGNLSMRGNSNVRILVDGKPTNIEPSQLLKQIPSSSIKSVELITNPSAKYNPEGMSGIINIVLYKNANLGFNGSFNSGYTYGVKSKWNGSADLNYKTNKFNWFANYGINSGTSFNKVFINRTDNQTLQDLNILNQSNSHLAKFGFDFYINPKNTFSFYTIQNAFNADADILTKVDFVLNDNPDLIQDNFIDNDNDTQTYNFNYKIDFAKEGHNLEVEANLSETNSKEKAVFDFMTDTDQIRYVDLLRPEQTENIFNIDYVNPITEKMKLEAGLEFRTNENSIDFKTTNPDPNSVNTVFDYDRDIYSAYLTLGYNWEKVTLQAGVRSEYFEVDAVSDNLNVFNEDYFNLYPSVHTTWSPSEKNQFSLSYSRRVDRPGLEQTNPIRQFSTPTITGLGNPSLDPQFTNSYELGYTRQLGKGSISFTTFYRKIKDEITQTLFENPNDVTQTILSFDNVDDNEAYGFESSVNYKFWEWWNATVNFDLYQQTLNGVAGADNISRENTKLNLRVNNSFKATKKLNFQLFGMYTGRERTLQLDVEEMWRIDAGLRYKVLKDKGSLSLRVNDIFKTQYANFSADNPFPQSGFSKWESRRVYVGFSYNFSKGNIKSRNRKNRDDNTKSGGGIM
jgi:outer membrane receptor protein involved in Fe transport